MTSTIAKVKFVAKAEVFAPKYFKDELTALRNSGAISMIQIPGIFTTDPKKACKMVVGIKSNGQLMNNSSDMVVMPCPLYCKPPKNSLLVTLSSFLNS